MNSLTYKVLTTSQPDTYTLVNVQTTRRTRSSSEVTLARPSVSSSLQITNRSLDMHHLTCGISSLIHSVNLILFTLLLVRLILRTCTLPHHSIHFRSPSCTVECTVSITGCVNQLNKRHSSSTTFSTVNTV